MRKWNILILIVLFSFEMNAQEKSREVGLNMTQLVSQFIPFKGNSTLSGPFSFFYRRGKNDRFFNLQIGARVDSDNFETNFINFQVGYLRKRDLGNKFKYYNSINFIASAGGFNSPGTDFNDDFAGTGFSMGLGFEYNLTESIFLATETTFLLVLGSDGRLDILPPVAIFLAARY